MLDRHTRSINLLPKPAPLDRWFLPALIGICLVRLAVGTGLGWRQVAVHQTRLAKEEELADLKREIAIQMALRTEKPVNRAYRELLEATEWLAARRPAWTETMKLAVDLLPGEAKIRGMQSVNEDQLLMQFDADTWLAVARYVESLNLQPFLAASIQSIQSNERTGGTVGRVEGMADVATTYYRAVIAITVGANEQPVGGGRP